MEFDLKKYEWIGFDMDHTFAQYKLDALGTLIFNGLCKYLYEEHKYPEDLFKGLQYDVDFLTKGAVFDVEKGNFVYVTANGKVCCARHGWSHKLSEEEIVATYGADRQYEFFQDVQKFKSNHEKYLLFNSPFGLPGAQILGKLVDFVDAAMGKPSTYFREIKQLFSGYTHLYDPNSLETKTGLFFSSLATSPSEYIVKTPESVLQLLRECRSRGQKVFLMTNSKIDFTRIVMGESVGEGWEQLFDFVITSASKPGFFTKENPFEFLEEGMTKAELGKISVGGNWKSLREDLGVGSKPGSVLYFGDDLHGDVEALGRTEGCWDGVAIVEELGDNVHANEEHVFHCPKAALDVFETVWFDAIECHAKLCTPSVHAVAAGQVDGVLYDCKQNRQLGPTLWYPITPVDWLASAPSVSQIPAATL